MFDFLSDYAREQEKTQEKTQSSYQGSSSESRVLVLSLGGSLFFDEAPLVEKIGEFSRVLLNLHASGHKFVLVVGGGKTARNYVSAVESFGETNFFQDKLGIAITRANAKVFIASLGKQTHERVLTDPLQALDVLSKGKIPVFGGLLPSFTTDAVSALVAEALRGDFVNLTDVDGIYSADPKKSKSATFFDEISYGELFKLVLKKKSKPGQNFIIDLPCLNILKRSNLRGFVLNGNDFANFESFVNGGQFRGTVIHLGEEQTENSQ